MKQEIIRINLDGVNCYLGKSDEGYILFDTGGPITMDKVFNDRCAKLEEELEKAGCNKNNLKAIILTHGDIDHVANAAYLRNKYKCIIGMHCNDVELVENLTIDKMMESFHYRSAVLKLVFLLLKKVIVKVNSKIISTFQKFSPDILLNEGDSLLPYGFNASIIHLGGHTAGSIGILTYNGELISGDIMTNIKKPVPAPNAYDFKQLENSIKRIRTLKVEHIYPGHGEPFDTSNIRNA